MLAVGTRSLCCLSSSLKYEFMHRVVRTMLSTPRNLTEPTLFYIQLIKPIMYQLDL